MTFNSVELDKTETRLQGAARRWSCGETFSIGWATGCLVAVVATVAVVSVQTSPARAVAVDCPTTEGQDLKMPPEIASSEGVLSGKIFLSEEFQSLRLAKGDGSKCVTQTVRVFRVKNQLSDDRKLRESIPGPTLRAKVGDSVQLTFINQVDSSRFDPNIDIEACMEVGENGKVYPGTGDGKFDKYPNCLHASSTANIHFHGTHTNPDSLGDNVYLQVRPLPRDNQGKLTTTAAEASVGFNKIFSTCAEKLEKNPMDGWPTTWGDLPQGLNNPWIVKQTELLTAYQNKNNGQDIWTKNLKALEEGEWPQYYIGAVPYCFALPKFTAEEFPPPPGSKSLVMGQYPGTQWYHAHKHGSTAINVANGMTGAFIIEGDYDKYLDDNYGSYILKGGKKWTARSQPVMVLNQLGTTPNRLAGDGGGEGGYFVVNGQFRPTVQMQPGEVQLWRIINTSARSAAYFMVPEGLEWRQLAQDGVQFADKNYQNSLNKPFYMAPANRVDLLVKAPVTQMTTKVQFQKVMSLTGVKRNTGWKVLMTVNVSGEQVRLGKETAEMQFLESAPPQPKFLADITDEELKESNYISRKLEFHSKNNKGPKEHTINGVQFSDELRANIPINLGAVEEWTVSNSGRKIDHPFHIHINPFQITEVFDPNERLTDPVTGKLQTVPRYVTDKENIKDRQCYLDLNNPATWSVAGACGAQEPQTDLVWWDTFAIPAGRDEGNVTIPGYFKMRSRFVDYAGHYVLHCHILIHEDRGMMFSVTVTKPEINLAQH